MGQSKKELIAAAFENKPVDRIPSGFWYHFLEDPYAMNSAEIAKIRLNKQKEFIEVSNPDFVKIMTDGFFRHPNLRNIDSIKDLALRKGLDDDDPWFTGQIEYAKALTDIYGNEIDCFYNIFSFASMLKFSQDALRTDWAGRDPWVIQLIQDDASSFYEASSRISADLAKLSQRLIKEAHVSGIYFSTQNILGLPQHIYQQIIAPGEKSVLAAANSLHDFNILHICGYAGHTNDITWYKDYDVKAINWAVKIEGIPLEEGKKLFDGRTVIGGFGNGKEDVLYKGTRQDIESEMKSILARSGRTGVIFGADCTVPNDIETARLQWVRDIAEHL
jgi:uroporphyrinogen decarboxylase